MKGELNENKFWAKLERSHEGSAIQWHPLIAHSADVAAVTEALLRRTALNQRLANIINKESLNEVNIARLAALTAIHDAGKANHGFQNRAFEHKKPQSGHVSPIIDLINADAKTQEEYLLPLGIGEMLEWFRSDEDLVHFLMATWGHHGRPVKPGQTFRKSLWKDNNERVPLEELRSLGQSLHKWFPTAYDDKAEKFPSEPCLQHAFNGLLTLADWIGSDPKFFPFAEDLSNYIEKAREKASHAIDKLVLDPSLARKQLGKKTAGFGSISEWEPYDIQEKCQDLPLFENGSLTVLESDTGSGKTEAALARFIRLYQAGLVDGMYFAVPTRSAATQLYKRVQEAVVKAFSDENSRPPVVQAVPGYIKVDDVEGKPLPPFEVQWPDDQQDYLRERGWAGEHPKRYLAGAVVVGTIDQVLLSTLQVSHAHMRATALLRHFLVVDEVHASDAYMSRLLDRVLNFHLEAGGHALLMSATLGTASRLHLTSKTNHNLPSPKESEQISYPLITHVDSSRDNPTEWTPDSSNDQKEVCVTTEHIAGKQDQIARMAVQKAKKGARVLIIRNLVDDCIKTQKALEELLDNNSDLLFKVNSVSAPHHSRFAPEDRNKLDQAIESTFGKDTESSSIIAVATQTVEQSLDIDADFMITDLCPMDVFLQRLGRLQRHNKQRPEEFQKAHCIVLTPGDRDLENAIGRDGKGAKGKHGLGTVYQDLRVIEATWRVLENDQNSTWEIPSHNRKLVEQATHPQILWKIVEELEGKWTEHQQYIEGQRVADRQIPNLVGIDFSKPFGQEGFAEDLKNVKTRLGRDDYQVFLPNSRTSPFGEQVEEMTITEWQLAEKPDKSDNEADSISSFEGGFSFKFHGQSFRYDRFGLTPNS